jgi:hypothetical protein
MTEGLDPNRGGTGASAGSTTFEEHSRGHVHYTRKLGLAEDYQRHFQARSKEESPFGRENSSPEAAEVLQVVIRREVAGQEEIDPDSKAYDRAFRTTRAISPEYIRRTDPVPLPPPRERRGKKGRPEPLVPNANGQAWRDHWYRTFSERWALLSNMPSTATDVLYDIMKRGLDVDTVLQIVTQALRSMSTDDILEIIDREANPRVMQNRMDPTGKPLPFMG